MFFRRVCVAAARNARPLAVLSCAGAGAGAGAFVVRCEPQHSAEPAAYRHAPEEQEKEEEETALSGAIRGITGLLGSEGGELLQQQAARTFRAFASKDGKLTKSDVEAAVQTLSVGHQDAGLLWELGPLLWRMMAADRNGCVTLSEFVVGQQLLAAVAKADNFEDYNKTGKRIEELCWRALDVNGTGTVKEGELSVMVRLMLHLRVVDDDLAKKVKGRERSAAAAQTAVTYYMRLYDLDGDGIITREDFAKCKVLQRSFWRLLTKQELKPIFLTHRHVSALTKR